MSVSQISWSQYQLIRKQIFFLNLLILWMWRWSDVRDTNFTAVQWIQTNVTCSVFQDKVNLIFLERRLKHDVPVELITSCDRNKNFDVLNHWSRKSRQKQNSDERLWFELLNFWLSECVCPQMLSLADKKLLTQIWSCCCVLNSGAPEESQRPPRTQTPKYTQETNPGHVSNLPISSTSSYVSVLTVSFCVFYNVKEYFVFLFFVYL